MWNVNWYYYEINFTISIVADWSVVCGQRTVPRMGSRRIFCSKRGDYFLKFFVDFLGRGKITTLLHYASLLVCMKIELQQNCPWLSHKIILFYLDDALPHPFINPITKFIQLVSQFIWQPPLLSWFDFLLCNMQKLPIIRKKLIWVAWDELYKPERRPCWEIIMVIK